MQSGFDGDELLVRPSIQLVTVDPATAKKAEQQIESCEHCHPYDAEIPFDWILAEAIGKRGPIEFILIDAARCPNCKHEDARRGGWVLCAILHSSFPRIAAQFFPIQSTSGGSAHELIASLRRQDTDLRFVGSEGERLIRPPQIKQKSTVPFGGVFPFLDFTLSNVPNSERSGFLIQPQE